MASANLFFYGFRTIGDLDGICVNMDTEYLNKTDSKSKDLKKIELIFSDKKTKLYFMDFGITNSKKWKNSWDEKNLIISKFFGLENFNDLCWNPNYHLYYRGVKCYLIEFEFYRKIQRIDEKIDKKLVSTLSKDYTDFIMINNLNQKLIEKFIYVDKADGKLKVSKLMLKEFPNLYNLQFNNTILEFIKKFLLQMYKPYLNPNINDKYIKSLFM